MKPIIKSRLGRVISSWNFIIAVVFVVSLIAITTSLFVTAQGQRGETTYGPNYETVCENGICETIFYSYEKYWFNENNEWEEINEEWYACGNDYCTERYHFDATADNTGLVTAFRADSGNTLSIRLANLLDRNLNFNPTIQGSVLTYEDVIPDYVDIRYQYLPRKIKEEIIIKQPLPNLPENDFNIAFTKSGNADFAIRDFVICDAKDICGYLEHTIEGDNINVQIPVDFLRNENTTYPIIIDPTITLDDSDIAWNGYVSKYSPISFETYTRFSNPSSITIGNYGGSPAEVRRGDIDWNIISVPDNSDIFNVTLELFLEDTGGSNNLDVNHMEGDNFIWPNDNDGNGNFWEDMNNGTNYASPSVNGNNFSINISLGANGAVNFENALGINNFSVGLISSHPAKNIKISARDNANATRRPKMRVVYGDSTNPTISFVDPTPVNASTQQNSDIYVNLSSQDNFDHYAFTDFNNNVVLWMRMDDVNSSGDPVDISSYGNNGSLNGDAFINESGYYGDGSYYDETDDYVKINDDSSLHTQAFTASTWVKFDGLSANDAIIRKGLSGSWMSYGVKYHSGLNGFRFTVQNESSGDFPSWDVTFTPTTGQWYHIAATFGVNSGTSSDGKVYINGVEQSTTFTANGYDSSFTIGYSNVGLYLASRDGTDRFFGGAIDEVMVFNRVLTEDEIKSLYNASENQYEHNFTGLSDATYKFTGHAVDNWGNRGQTDERFVTIKDLANESDGDSAIEQGINDSLPGNPIESNQQIYLVNETGGHFLGTFDKVTVLGNQTWAFNYITEGESFVNMPSMFNIVNIWENQSLTYDEIVGQVGAFINQTLY